MANATLLSLNAGMKTLYEKPNRIENACYENHVLTGMLPKEEGFIGRDFQKCPILFSGPGFSANFTDAQSDARGAALASFLLERVSVHSVPGIDAEAAEASEGAEGAFISGLKLQADAAFNGLGADIESQLFRNGSGSRGVIDATYGGAPATTIPIVADGSIANFEVGMVLNGAASEAAATRGAGTNMTILGMDATAAIPTIEVSAAAAALAPGDHLFVNGDYDDAGASIRKLWGLDRWLPSIATVGTWIAPPDPASTLAGVVRNVDVQRLAGCRLARPGFTMEQASIDGCSEVDKFGGAADLVVMHSDRYADLTVELNAKGTYNMSELKQGTPGRVSFSGVVINGHKGPVNVVSSPFCKNDVIYCLTLKTWKLYTLGRYPKFQDLDGLKVRAQATAEGFESRIVARGQLGCMAPGRNCRVEL